MRTHLRHLLHLLGVLHGLEDLGGFARLLLESGGVIEHLTQPRHRVGEALERWVGGHLLEALLPAEASDELNIAQLLRGKCFHFGSPVEQCGHQMQSGLLHPKVQRYRQDAERLRRVEAMQAKRDLHNSLVYRLVKQTEAQQKPYEGEEDDEA